MLKCSLESGGFKAGDINQCLFIQKDMIVFSFVDDLIYIGHNFANIVSKIADLVSEFLLSLV